MGRITAKEWLAITSGLLAGAGMDPTKVMFGHIKEKPKTQCANSTCEKEAKRGYQYCSAECCKEARERDRAERGIKK